jgi:excisionase family DNA binding protein
MLTVPEAARRANRNPETIRRWIRAGKLPARKVGTQHVIEDEDLDAVLDDEYEMLPLPEAWRALPDGRPMPNVVRWVRESRRRR